MSSDNSDLILNKREVETTVTVDDGADRRDRRPADDNERRTIEKIPLLGDIPGSASCSDRKAKQRSKTNLMVFIRPTILRSPEDQRRVTEQRYGYLRLQQAGQDPDARADASTSWCATIWARRPRSPPAPVRDGSDRGPARSRAGAAQLDRASCRRTRGE